MGNFTNFLISIPAVVIAIGFHEAAHAYAAYQLGDNTAKNQGRLTVNPLSHIDPIGFIMLFLFHFGWAKPVPVNPNNFKDKKKGMMITALAGPLANLAIAFGAMFVLGILSQTINPDFLNQTGAFSIMISYGLLMIWWIISINIGLAVFNLIPVPPLDGSKIFLGMLPSKYYYKVLEKENVIYFVMILLLITGVLGTIIRPISNLVYNGMGIIVDNVLMIFFR